VVSHRNFPGDRALFLNAFQEGDMPLYTIALYQGQRCAWLGAERAFIDDDEALHAALVEYEYFRMMDEDPPPFQEWRIEVSDGRSEPLRYSCEDADHRTLH
jgi:hypothetical protein